MAHNESSFSALDVRFLKAQYIFENGGRAAAISARTVRNTPVELWEHDREIARFDLAEHQSSTNFQPWGAAS
jgi:hypothetical protein